MPIEVINRSTYHKEREDVFGESAIRFLYRDSFLSRILCSFVCQLPLLSHLFGWWQKQSWTKKNVNPFIKRYGIDKNEFEKKHFSSFNDFFIRKLKSEARPISKAAAIIPADGRYRFFKVNDKKFRVKDKAFHLNDFLQDNDLAAKYVEGTIVLARLCPTDCHRFLFPIDCIPQKPHLINGPLYSVNPIALNKNFKYLTENKRLLISLNSEYFGKALCVLVGATNVGSITLNFTSGKHSKKGEEMGYFSFGGSAIALIFPNKSLQLAKDLVTLEKDDIEIRCLMGQSLASTLQNFPLPSN